MKKLWLVVLSGAVAIGVGCSKNGTPATPSATATSTPATAAPTEAPTPDPTAPTPDPTATADQPPPVPTGESGVTVLPGGGQAKLSNPASLNCVAMGGKLEILAEPSGEFGVCVFPDGSRCEEWAFHRGKCQPGQCHKTSGKCP